MSYSCSDFFDVVTDQLYRNGLINGGPPDEDVDIEAVTTEVADAIQGLLEQRLSDRNSVLCSQHCVTGSAKGA